LCQAGEPHNAGGEVLKLIGDGVLAMFTGEDMTAVRRAALRAEHQFRVNMEELNARRSAESRPVTSAYVGLHVGEVFYGNIGSEDRLDFTVVGPAVNEVSRIASMCNSIDREFLASSEFRAGLDATGRRYLVSTGRYALRGVGRAQDLYTLDPEIAANEAMAAACSESFPSLLFPCLFEEKVEEVVKWFRHQQRVLKISRASCGQLGLLGSFNNSPLTETQILDGGGVNTEVMKKNFNKSEMSTVVSHFGSFVSSLLSKRSLAMHS